VSTKMVAIDNVHPMVPNLTLSSLSSNSLRSKVTARVSSGFATIRRKSTDSRQEAEAPVRERDDRAHLFDGAAESGPKQRSAAEIRAAYGKPGAAQVRLLKAKFADGQEKKRKGKQRGARARVCMGGSGRLVTRSGRYPDTAPLCFRCGTAKRQENRNKIAEGPSRRTMLAVQCLFSLSKIESVCCQAHDLACHLVSASDVLLQGIAGR
jgi:hypothetical protein